MKFFKIFTLFKRNPQQQNVRQFSTNNINNNKFDKRSTQFVLDVVGELYQPGHNLLLSPYSLTCALVMVLLGTDCNSQAELVKVLFDKNDDDGSKGDCYAQAWADMNKFILSTNAEILKIANLLYAHKSFPIQPEYVSTMTEQLGAICKEMNFKNENTALKAINEDVEKATNGLIKQILNSIDPQSKVILVNTVYFKGLWSTEFGIEATNEEGVFHTSSGTIVRTALMFSLSKYPFYQDKSTGVKAIELGYTNGNICMVAILPGEGVPIETYLKTHLSTGSSFLSHILNNLKSSVNVRLTLPRFKLKALHHLAGPIATLGIRDIFEQSSANLSRLSACKSGQLHVSQIIQHSTIEVNEQGTEATASTAPEIFYSLGPSKPVRVESFEADRPFLFALVTKTGTSKQVIFIGVIEDPTKGEKNEICS